MRATQGKRLVWTSIGVAREVNLTNPLHAGKEARKRGIHPWGCHQKSKTGVSVAPQKGLVFSKISNFRQKVSQWEKPSVRDQLIKVAESTRSVDRTNSRLGSPGNATFTSLFEIVLHPCSTWVDVLANFIFISNIVSFTAPTQKAHSCSVTRALWSRWSVSWVCLTTARYPSLPTTTSNRRTERTEPVG